MTVDLGHPPIHFTCHCCGHPFRNLKELRWHFMLEHTAFPFYRVGERHA